MLAAPARAYRAAMAPRPPPARSHCAQNAKQHQTASETHRRGGVEAAERRAVRPSWVLSSQLAQSKPLRTEQCKLRNPSPLVRRGLIERLLQVPFFAGATLRREGFWRR